MDEMRLEWCDITNQINNSISFLDRYFQEERSDDKTAAAAYRTLRLCAESYLKVGNRLAEVKG